jgi:phosphoenolpyruvate-protein kinase (PTS system EI component)
MIRRVATNAHAKGKRVSVCGEMAARPELAIALLALGVDSLSVTPRSIPDLKQALARVPVEPLRASLDTLLKASTADEVEALLRRYSRGGGPLTANSEGTSLPV